MNDVYCRYFPFPKIIFNGSLASSAVLKQQLLIFHLPLPSFLSPSLRLFHCFSFLLFRLWIYPAQPLLYIACDELPIVAFVELCILPVVYNAPRKNGYQCMRHCDRKRRYNLVLLFFFFLLNRSFARNRRQFAHVLEFPLRYLRLKQMDSESSNDGNNV